MEENIDQKNGKNRCPYPVSKFSQEHVFATLRPILENVSSGKLNRGRHIVKTKLNNVLWTLKRRSN